MANYLSERTWWRWHGTVGDLCRVVGVATREMETWTPPAPATVISIQHKGGLLSSGIALDEFEQLPDTDLPRIRRIEIVIGEHYRAPGVRIVVRAGDPEALQLQVEADDRSHAEGLASRLTSVLDSGRSRPQWLGLIPRFALTLVFVAVGIGWIIGTTTNYVTGVITPHRYAVDVAVSVASECVAFLIFFLFPPLQLLQPGQRTRVWRYGGLAIGGLATLALGVAAIFLADLFQR
jgi:hypothetical protein